MSEAPDLSNLVSTGKKRRRSPWRKAVSRYFGYFVLRAAHAFVCRLPLPVGRALARVAGTLAYHIARRERAIATVNLTRAYGGEKSPEEIRRIARDVFRNLALTVAEWAILRRWPAEKLLRTFPEVWPVVDRMVADVRAGGSGAVGITAHLGNWEVLSLFVGGYVQGFLVPVANRVYFEKYQEFVHRMRTECGLEVIYTDESVRKIIRAIRDGKLLGILPDVDLRTNSGIFVDFFGSPAYTVTLPMELARKLDVPIIVAYLRRDGKRFRVVYSVLRAPRTGDEAADVREATAAWTRVLEEEIRRDPAQWAWVQPRWRTTPEKPRTRVRGRHGDEGGGTPEAVETAGGPPAEGRSA